MQYKIIYKDSAKDDLLKYSDYIERMTFSKEKADELLRIIMSEILKLSLFPYMYQVFYKNFHSFSVKNQRIIYYIDEEKKQVVIYRILWWYQDYTRYI